MNGFISNSYIDPRNSWEKFCDKIYPPKYCMLPEAPIAFKDVLVCRTGIAFSFVDRIRILLTGKVYVESRTVTEHTIGNCITSSVAYPTVKL